MRGRKMSIPECHFDILMSEQLLDRGQINTCHDEVRREGMPDIMEMEIYDVSFSACCAKLLSGNKNVSADIQLQLIFVRRDVIMPALLETPSFRIRILI